MATKIFRSVILGAPAAGKGTIAARIVKDFNVKHLSTGDKLRVNIQNKTPIGKEAHKYIKNGKLVPDEVMIKFIANELKQIKNSSWLLDGFPRTLSQAEALWDLEELDLAINVVVPFPVIIERVKGRMVHLPSGRVYNKKFNKPKVPGKDDVTGEPLTRREDDKPEVVAKRLKEYEIMTLPVIKFYRKKKVLTDFEGEATDEIWPDLRGCIATYTPLKKEKD